MRVFVDGRQQRPAGADGEQRGGVRLARLVARRGTASTIALPTSTMMLTCSFSMRSQTPAGSNEPGAVSTTLPPRVERVERGPVRADVHEGRGDEEAQPLVGYALDELLGLGDLAQHPDRVAAAHRGVEDVLVPPQHTLGQSRRAAGAGDVVVVRGPPGPPAAPACTPASASSYAVHPAGTSAVAVVVDDEHGPLGQQRRRRPAPARARTAARSPSRRRPSTGRAARARGRRTGS